MFWLLKTVYFPREFECSFRYSKVLFEDLFKITRVKFLRMKQYNCRWRNNIPSFKIAFPCEVLVSSDYRPYRNLALYNVLVRQGSSFRNRARLNFQAFALRD